MSTAASNPQPTDRLIARREVLADRPQMTDEELDALENRGHQCGITRPDTLGHQHCWRLRDHDGPHVSQDREAWFLSETPSAPAHTRKDA